MGHSHGDKAVTNDSNQKDDDLLFASRLVPLGRKGNIVYARSLRPGEEDTGEVVHLKAGEELVIPAGELIIDSREIDAYYNPAGPWRLRASSEYGVDLVPNRAQEARLLPLRLYPRPKNRCRSCTIGIGHPSTR